MLAVGKRRSIEICLSLLIDVLSEQDLLKASAVGVKDESCGWAYVWSVGTSVI